MTNPYKGVQDHQMWRRAVSRVEAHMINPAVSPRFEIGVHEKVATAGSCFAQHISRRISKIGFNYYCPELGSHLDDAERERLQYGLFSARYGNIYTVHQLRQLFDEAMNGATKQEQVWERGDVFVDPYRPNISPEGFTSPDKVMAARQEHLASVRDLFLNCDIFVFTLGLTEAWRSKRDGSVFPLAPGVGGGAYDPEQHEFHNFDVDEVRTELRAFISALKEVNPGAKVLLTVSPVPLIATFEDRHVLASTTYSKAVLRVAAQDAYDRFDHVDYFPSYEIITGSATGGLYYEDDCREVNRIGVSHAMRCFLNAYTGQGGVSDCADIASGPDVEFSKAAEVVCDEEEIERSIRT